MSDQDKPDTKPEEPKKNLNIPHEDLSDVSDLEDSIGDHSNADSIKSTEKSKVETDAKPVNGDSTNKKVYAAIKRTKCFETLLTFVVYLGCREVE